MIKVHIQAFALSPVGRWFNEILSDLTSPWAMAAAVIVLVIALIGIKRGDSGMRSKMVTLFIVAVIVLLVQAFVAFSGD